MYFRKQLNKEQALQKLRHYCAYQDRCHSEVRSKLFNLGVNKKEHDEIIATLIEEKYLDEERFAIAFAGGKFRLKGWGRTKISYGLRQKQISEYCIKKALQQISEMDYENKLKKLAEEKYKDLRNEQWIMRKKKTLDYMEGKGYEPELVLKFLNSLSNNE